jgi:hypothetical protein
MPRRTDDLISIALGETPARTKSPKNRETSTASANGDQTPAQSVESTPPDTTQDVVSTPAQTDQSSTEVSEEQGEFIEVRPIGTTQGLRELAQLYKKAGGELGALERKVHMMLWPLALHFGLYRLRPGRDSKRPPLVGAFWARSLAESPVTLGHLYPPALFRGLLAGDVYEFGGMVVDAELRKERLMAVMIDTVRLFLFSRRPELVIANPVMSLHDLYKQLGLKTVGTRPVDHPQVRGVKVYLMYGRFKDLAGPFFM